MSVWSHGTLTVEAQAVDSTRIWFATIAVILDCLESYGSPREPALRNFDAFDPQLSSIEDTIADL